MLNVKVVSHVSHQYQSPSTYSSFRGSIINGGGKQTVTLKPSTLHFTPTDPTEIPPKVPPRRESINPLPLKAELPIHLISTTNQVHKPPVVQQQIPTKLATLSKGKEKGARSKGSHQRTHSAGQDGRLGFIISEWIYYI